MVDFLESLNEKQREAVLKTEGPVLVLAGAGSGKTRTLTFRVAHLIKNKQVAPRNILALTFTNKAAGEMAERIGRLFGITITKRVYYSDKMPHLGTFHSICGRILRKESGLLGYDENFVIYGESEQLTLAKQVAQDLKISSDRIKPKNLLAIVSSNKNKLISADEFASEAGSFFQEEVAKFYTLYQTALKKSNAMDFDDLIFQTVFLLKKFPAIKEKYGEIFRYILVDEYQDTNRAQYLLLKLLAEKNRNLCVVGDDFQAIYGWRGAEVENILNFEKDYPEAKVVLLEQNYRSTGNILEAAHCIISHNSVKKEKKLWTENEKGSPIVLVETPNEKAEAAFVVNEIEKIKKETGCRWEDFAVLYRTNVQSRVLEEAFMQKSLPYKIVGGLKFYLRKEIKDVLALLTLALNPKDQANFRRVFDFLAEGLGEKTLEKIFVGAEKKSGDLLLSLKELSEKKVFPPAKLVKVEKFWKILEKNQRELKEKKVTEAIEYVCQNTQYQQQLEKEGDKGKERWENVQELLTVAQKYDEFGPQGLKAFLEEVALISQVDEDLSTEGAVPLITLHGAKGLEYDTVFIVGMEEGIFPHSRATFNPQEMEEERRLCYVGITRAKKRAYLVYAVFRHIYGTVQSALRSRFIEEIRKDLLEERVIFPEEEWAEFSDEKTFRHRKSRNKSMTQLIELEDLDWEEETKEVASAENLSEKLSAEQEIILKDGDAVKHPQFGQGILISSDQEVYKVVFPQWGLKKIIKGKGFLKKI
mgnify:CR=1 FL=1